MNKYIKCFTNEDLTSLIELGFKHLYTQNGVHYFENDKNLTTKFSNTQTLENVKFTNTLNF